MKIRVYLCQRYRYGNVRAFLSLHEREVFFAIKAKNHDLCEYYTWEAETENFNFIRPKYEFTHNSDAQIKKEIFEKNYISTQDETTFQKYNEDIDYPLFSIEQRRKRDYPCKQTYFYDKDLRHKYRNLENYADNLLQEINDLKNTINNLKNQQLSCR